MRERLLGMIFDPGFDWGFYMITGISFIWILRNLHYAFHLTAQKVRYDD
jgi:hypothetical protein